MFGYVKVNSGELRVKEYELYRGAYCGLCRAMGKCTGQCSRMSLSYDFAFLVMARLALTNTKMSFSQRRCLAHPLKKRNVMDRNEQLDVCAYSAAVLGYHKIKDDLADEKGLKYARAALTYPFVKHWRKKAVNAGFCELDKKVEDNLEKLSALEKDKTVSVDAPAALFGDILSDITSYGLEGSERRIACQVGKCVGKWIYIVDALDDMIEDKKRRRYNPFLLLYGGELPSETQLKDIEDALKLELLGAETAMDLLETEKILVKNVMENILYLGMPDTAKSVIHGIGLKEDKNEKRKEDVE